MQAGLLVPVKASASKEKATSVSRLISASASVALLSSELAADASLVSSLPRICGELADDGLASCTAASPAATTVIGGMDLDAGALQGFRALRSSSATLGSGHRRISRARAVVTGRRQ